MGRMYHKNALQRFEPEVRTCKKYCPVQAKNKPQPTTKNAATMHRHVRKWKCMHTGGHISSALPKLSLLYNIVQYSHAQPEFNCKSRSCISQLHVVCYTQAILYIYNI